MKSSRSFISGGIFAIATRGVYALAQVLYLGIMARLLEPADFGIFAIATSITILATMLTDFGFSTSVFQCKTLNSRQASALFWANLGLAFILTVLLIMGRDLFANFFGEDRLRSAILFLALTLPFSAVAAFYKALLSRRQIWSSVYTGFLFCQLTALILSVLAGIAWKDFTALLVNPIATSVLSALMFSYHTRWIPRRKAEFRASFTLLGQGGALSATGISNFINRQSDNVMIGWQWSAADLGIYTRAYSIFTIPSTIFVLPLQPVILSLLAKRRNDPIEWMTTWATVSLPILLTTAFISVIFYRFAGTIVPTLYGTGWDTAVPILNVLSLSIVASTIGQLVSWAIISKRGSTMLLAYSMMTALIRLLAFIIAVPFGVLYVAIAWTITSWIFSLTLVALAIHQNILRRESVLPCLVPVTFGTAVCVGLANLAPTFLPAYLPSIAGSFVECLLYAAILCSFVVLNADSRNSLVKSVSLMRRK